MTPRIVPLLALWLFTTPATAIPLWSVVNAEGTSEVLLLGSVHMLRAEHQPLPESLCEAYLQSDRVVMELDPRELEPAAAQAALGRVGVLTPGRAVADLLSEEEWRHAEALAAAAGLRLATVAALEPWFAAVALQASALAQAGFDPALGVDQQVAGWARRDGKPVTGLETIDEQLLLFKVLDKDMQRRMLLKTLEELATAGSDTEELVGRWRAGDLESLEQRLEEDFRDFEALYASIVTDRNRAWLPAITALLDKGGTSLVVVGALHLVGPEGVPALLARRLPGAQISMSSKSSLPAPQSGQRQLSGTSSQCVPGGIPPSGSPAASSYTYPQITHIQAFINEPSPR
jgi:uncharacterized protein